MYISRAGHSSFTHSFIIDNNKLKLILLFLQYCVYLDIIYYIVPCLGTLIYIQVLRPPLSPPQVEFYVSYFYLDRHCIYAIVVDHCIYAIVVVV